MGFRRDEFFGTRLGKYELVCRLSVGGMAEIYLARLLGPAGIAKPVIIKRVLTANRDRELPARMILDEARLSAELSHPNVAQLIDLDVVEQGPYLVFEFVPGATLSELAIAADRKLREPLPLGFTVAVVREAAAALHHAHVHCDSSGVVRPIIHRDVTPRNVMVSYHGITKVLDFGIARQVGGPRFTVAGMVRGTAAYMSPEQAVGRQVDPRSDLFSLGVVLYELLSGRRLFGRDTPAAEMSAVVEAKIPRLCEANPKVPAALDAVVMRALVRTRDRRTQTGLELARELASCGVRPFEPEERAAWVCRLFEARRKATRELLGGMAGAPSPGSLDHAPTVPGLPPAGMNEEEALEISLSSGVPPAFIEASTAIGPPSPTHVSAQTPTAPIARRSRLPLAVAALMAMACAAVGLGYLAAPQAPSSARLSLEAEPEAVVFLPNGTALGRTPLREAPLPSGAQTLRLIGPDGRRHRLPVTVPPAAELRLSVRLADLATE